MVLASNSPRRREILTQGGLEYIVDAADVDENVGIDDPVGLVEALSLKKSMAVADSHPESIIIGADTVVALGSEIMGKPADEADARAMLKKLSGVTHQVVTGVTLIKPEDQGKREHVTFHSVTDVTFYELSDEEIEAYVSTKEPLDKAGAYGIQGRGALLVESISGEYLNVVGLPLGRLNQELKKISK
ncbi:MAG: Maf family protein [Lachnospiraceae bacterium]|nr:Maf family protein [Lachnospiraceae bacterium]